MRKICQDCQKPQRTCICPFLPEQKLSLPDNKCAVIVLQYPKEANHKYGSVQLIKHVFQGGILVLKQSKIRTDQEFDDIINQVTPTGFLGKVQPVLIFPLKNTTPVLERQDDSVFYVYICIDATWDTAKIMYLSSPPLRVLPVFKLDVTNLDLLRSSTEGSNYHKLRKEIDGGMSTLEAVVCCIQNVPECQAQAAKLLEVSDKVTAMLSSFKPRFISSS